jgi:hypothetical protein
LQAVSGPLSPFRILICLWQCVLPWHGLQVELGVDATKSVDPCLGCKEIRDVRDAKRPWWAFGIDSSYT